jgi:hypothetical protein
MMNIVPCVYSAMCIILACDVYLSDLQVLKIWDFGSTARSGQAKYGKAKQSQASSVESPQKHPKPCDEGGT